MLRIGPYVIHEIHTLRRRRTDWDVTVGRTLTVPGLKRNRRRFRRVTPGKIDDTPEPRVRLEAFVDGYLVGVVGLLLFRRNLPFSYLSGETSLKGLTRLSCHRCS